MSNASKNTDRELWRELDEGNGSYYSPSIHVTESGGIGINVGGTVIVRPLREWHKLAQNFSPTREEVSGDVIERAESVVENWLKQSRFADVDFPGLGAKLIVKHLVDAGLVASPKSSTREEGLEEALKPFAVLCRAAFPIGSNNLREDRLQHSVVYSYRDSRADEELKITVPDLRRLADIYEALSPSSTVQGWRSIESAPKEPLNGGKYEGPMLLLYDEKEIFIGSYFTEHDGARWIPRDGDDPYFDTRNPTHWMPLPEAPMQGDK